MKKFGVLCGFAFLFSSTLMGAGQECDLAIRDGNAAQDLNRILQCFDQRLKAIETTMSGFSGQNTNTPTGASSFPTVTHEGIAFTVQRVSRSKDKKMVSVVLSVVNTKEEPTSAMFVAPAPSLIDDEANMVYVRNIKDVGGIAVCEWNNGFGKSPDCSKHKEDTEYTTLTPNNKVTVLLKFIGDSEITGKKLSFASVMLVKKGPTKEKNVEFRTINISMADLTLGE